MLRLACLATLAMILAACGGGGSDSSSSGNSSSSSSSSSSSGGCSPGCTYSISVSSSGLTFSSQATGTTSAAQVITITNTGTGSLSISAATIGGANPSSFADTNGCASTLATNATCTISVTFGPGATGSLSATLSVVSNASTSPTAVSLTGTGVAPPTATLTANPAIAQAGQQTTLTWSSTGATACNAAGSWSGSQVTNGAVTVTSSSTPGYYTYTINCSGNGAMASESVIFAAYGNTPIVQSGTAQPIWYEDTIQVPTPNQIIGFQTTTVVPPLPASSSNTSAYIDYWPGLDPAYGSVNYSPINDGVLQPVLEFATPYSSWVAISVYDNDNGVMPPIVDGYQTTYPQEVDGDNNFNSAHAFTVMPGDEIVEDMTLDQTTGYWTVNLTDITSNETTTLIMNMQSQGQNLAYFALEIWYGMPMNNPAIFTNSTLTFAAADITGICSDTTAQNNNYGMTPPTLDATGTKCSIAEVVLHQN